MLVQTLPWVTGNEVIVENVNANIPVSLSWFLLPFLASFASLPQLNSLIQDFNGLIWPNSAVSLRFCDSAAAKYEKMIWYFPAAESQNCKRGQPRFCRETELDHIRPLQT